MPTIQHALGETYYQVKGRNNKPPIIALHGGPGSGFANSTGLFDLAVDRKVYLYDQIGCDKSSPIKKHQCTIKTFVDELKLLKKAWGISQFHLIGTSWGTTLALEYYLATKDLDCLSITFQSPMFSAKDWKNDALALIGQLPKKTQKVIHACHDIGATDAQVYKKAMQDYYRRHVCRDEATLRKMFRKNDPNGKMVYQTMWGPSEFEPTGILKTYDRTKKISSIKVPTLLLCGRYDEARPKTVKRYADLIAGSSFKVIPKASHVILKENKQALLKAIEGFIRGVE